MDTTQINQKIKVGAVFDGNAVKPKWFIWINKKFEIIKITMTWKSAEGLATLTHFSVTDGNNLYELSFNRKTLEWLLEKVAVE